MSEGQELRVQLIEREEDFRAIESAWRTLYRENPSLSLFSSYDFIWLSWKHFSTPADSLYTLALWQGERLVAVLPLMLYRSRYRGIPCTCLTHIAAWEGDRPGVAAVIAPQIAWLNVFHYLERDRAKWQMLRLDHMETGDLPEGTFPWTANCRFSCFSEPDCESYFVRLQGSFEEYFASLPKTVKKRYRTRVRQAEEELGAFEFEEAAGPELFKRGLDRFAALEEKSWKGGCKEALSSNPVRWVFYRALCMSLEDKGGAKVQFLKTAKGDLAANLFFRFNGRLYAKQRVYDPAYASVSPGIINSVEVIRRHFNQGLIEMDMLGTPIDQGRPHHKADWATGKRATKKIIAIVNRSRLFPLATVKMIQNIIHNPAENSAGPLQPKSSQLSV